VLGTDSKLESNVFKKALLEKDITNTALDLPRREGILCPWLFLIVQDSCYLTVYSGQPRSKLYKDIHVLWCLKDNTSLQLPLILQVPSRDKEVQWVKITWPAVSRQTLRKSFEMCQITSSDLEHYLCQETVSATDNVQLHADTNSPDATTLMW